MMAAYRVVGTNYAVVGSGKRWHVYVIDKYDKAVAGPYTTRGHGVRWANEQHKL
jgi:hypothetical protein